MRYLKYVFVFLLGFLVANFWNEKKSLDNKQEEISIVVNSVKSLSKLVVSKATFSEVYNYSDSKKYFYDYLSFDKKAIVTINANVEVGYDLSKLEIQIDSVGKKIYINKIPEATTNVFPEIKYFDLQQSQFNTFSKEELNTINKKSIDKIKETIEVTTLKEEAKIRLFEELSKIYQLSAIYGWHVVDNTNSVFLSELKD